MSDAVMPEHWLPIPGYVGLYEVSDRGAVRSLDRPTDGPLGSRGRRGRILKQSTTPRGYQVVSLSLHGAIRQWRVHQLVMFAHVGLLPVGMEVCHNNGNPADNRVENLRFDSHSNNQRDQAKHGTHHKAAQERCVRGHEFTADNTYVTALGQRRCRACHREDRRAQYRDGLAEDRRSVTEPRLGGFCGKGHEFTPDNTYIDPAGRQHCRECRRAVLRSQHYKRKAAKSGRQDAERGDGGDTPT